MDTILQMLNDEQLSAVTSPSKFLQISAGPGTGKTSTLAAKILYLQAEFGIDAESMLAISFSRSAKAQLINKIREFTSKMGYGTVPSSNILTFHSFSHRIIRHGINNDESKFRTGFRTINTEDFIELDESIIKGLGVEYSNRRLLNNALASALNLIRQGNHLEEKPVVKLTDIPFDAKYKVKKYEDGRIIIHGHDLKTYWKKINAIEKIRNVTDFQGLISEAIRLLNLKYKTYEEITSIAKYIFVDEYQDTSMSQEKLLFSLLSDIKMLTVVGDKNQTIYTFNGSNYENMDRFMNYFQRQYPEQTEEVSLIQNYRSTEKIINFSNHIINEHKIIPANNSDLPDMNSPQIVETHSISLAAKYIATEIKRVQNEDFSLDDICILYRKNSEYSPQKDLVIEALTQSGIPFKESYTSHGKTQSFVNEIDQIINNHTDPSPTEILQILNQQNASKESINFIKECIDDEATDTEDILDRMCETQENVDSDAEGVTIRSVHSAKGLEYPVIFILYVGDRSFPHGGDPDIPEERRLFYVGVTRAKSLLHVIGEKGIEAESFLENCLSADVRHLQYNTEFEEEFNKGFDFDDKSIIDTTTKKLEEEERIKQEKLKALMDDEW